MTRFRWWLWWRLADRPTVCPANLYSAMFNHHRGEDRSTIRINDMCRKDAAECDGVCYCGKIRPAP